jgi:flagellar motility protein MotE (MotC chaperone)
VVAIILVVAGLVFAYIASWALIGGEIMTFGEDRADKILERLSMIEDEIDNHKHSIYLLEDEQEHLLEELKEIQEQYRLAEDRAWRQMKL